MDERKQQMSEHQDKLQELKKGLYVKFGNKINLEEN